MSRYFCIEVPDTEEHRMRHHLVALVPIVTIYLTLAFYNIDAQSLWTDEVISVNRVSLAGPIWKKLNWQSPPYFALLTVWTRMMGTTEFALRSLSSLLGLVSVCMIYAIGFQLFNRRTAVLGAILLATSPYFIWYAQEARYITLMLVPSLLMIYAFHRALITGLWRWWLFYGVVSAVAVFTFVTVILLVMAQGLYLLCNRSHRAFLGSWIACLLAASVTFVTWNVAGNGHRLDRFLQPSSVVSQTEVRRPQKLSVTDLVGTIPYTFFAFSAGFSLGPSLNELHEARSLNNLVSHGPILLPVAVLVASLFALGLAKLRQERDAAAFLLLWLAVPIIGAFLIATMTNFHVYNTRYVAIALPAYILILAKGIGSLSSSRAQLLLFASILCVNGASLFNYYFDSKYAKEDVRSTARYLQSAGRPGDVIVSVGSVKALRYYYKGELPIRRIDARGSKVDLVSEKLRDIGNGHGRLWLVEIRPWQRDPKGRIRATLEALARRNDHKEFPGVDIYSYQLH
ncbi:MAG: glycosyltransferase family 39 protein [Candidatus Binatia bacterium]